LPVVGAPALRSAGAHEAGTQLHTGIVTVPGAALLIEQAVDAFTVVALAVLTHISVGTARRIVGAADAAGDALAAARFLATGTLARAVLADLTGDLPLTLGVLAAVPLGDALLAALLLVALAFLCRGILGMNRDAAETDG
jgi:hypothetical protein